jgi:hypothetical protein
VSLQPSTSLRSSSFNAVRAVTTQTRGNSSKDWGRPEVATRPRRERSFARPLRSRSSDTRLHPINRRGPRR